MPPANKLNVSRSDALKAVHFSQGMKNKGMPLELAGRLENPMNSPRKTGV
jgi:hypothetical protein